MMLGLTLSISIGLLTKISSWASLPSNQKWYFLLLTLYFRRLLAHLVYLLEVLSLYAAIQLLKKCINLVYNLLSIFLVDFAKIFCFMRISTQVLKVVINVHTTHSTVHVGIARPLYLFHDFDTRDDLAFSINLFKVILM
jgi:hypothetical protein